MENVNELKLFSERLDKSQYLRKNLLGGSVSEIDASMREKAITKMFDNFQDVKEFAKNFSGYTENNLQSSQYFDATVNSLVNSFAGFVSIERALSQPKELVAWLDVLGVSDNRKVLPNLGAEDLSGINARITDSEPLMVGTLPYGPISLGKKLIPKTFKMELVHALGGRVMVTDDGQGNLLAPANVLDAGTINYATGAFSFTIGAAFTIAAGDRADYTVYADESAIPTTGGTGTYQNRVKADHQYVEIATAPDLLIAEGNLITQAGMQKVLGIDPFSFTVGKLTELYTKLINKKLVEVIQNKYTGNNIPIDITSGTTGYNDYQSSLQFMSGELVEVETALADKSVKGVNVTCYLVGKNVASALKKTTSIGKWVSNTAANYINDLYGYYDGIPVLRHTDIDPDTGYAIHKTADGNMAPVARGLFLPLAPTPAVMNYLNPTQVTAGVYYQDGTESLAPELVQKFTLAQD